MWSYLFRAIELPLSIVIIIALVVIGYYVTMPIWLTVLIGMAFA